MSFVKTGAFRGLSSDSDDIKIDSSGNVAFTNNNIVNKNLIINGGMNVYQRASSVSGILLGGYHLADRFEVDLNGAGGLTHEIVTDVPSGYGFSNAYKIHRSGPSDSLAPNPSTGNKNIFSQKIEGQNLQHLCKGTSNAKELTLSFWAKFSTADLTFTVELLDIDNNRQISKALTSSTSWTKYTITFPADTTGAFDNDNNASLQVNWWLFAGTDYTSGTLNESAWAAVGTANRVSSSNMYFNSVNSGNGNPNQFFITGVQLEIGGNASGFEFEPYETVLRKCHRYFVQDVFAYAGTMGGGSANIPLSIIQFPVRMCQAPAVSWISGGTVSDGQYDSSISSQNSTQNANPFSCRVLFNRNTSGTPSVVGRGCDIRGVTMKYDAEL